MMNENNSNFEFNPIEFGNFIRLKRKQLGLTLVELGNKTELSQAYLSQIESGKKEEAPSLFAVKQIARALWIDDNELLLLAGHIVEVLNNLSKNVLSIMNMNLAIEQELKLKIFLDDLSFANSLVESINSWLGKVNTSSDRRDDQHRLGSLFHCQELIKSFEENYYDYELSLGESIDYIRSDRLFFISAIFKDTIFAINDYTLANEFLNDIQSFFIKYNFPKSTSKQDSINLDNLISDELFTFKGNALTSDEKRKAYAILEVLFQ